MEYLTAVGAVVVLGWTLVNAAILRLAAPVVLGAQIKMVSAIVAAFLGMLLPGVSLGVLVVTPFGELALHLLQSEWRPFAQLTIGAVVLAFGGAVNLLVLRRFDRKSIPYHRAVLMQLVLMVAAAGLRALLVWLGFLSGFSWF